MIVAHNLDIPQSQIVQAYFLKANAIDIHNQYGQYSLGIEKVWRVTDGWKRLFQFIIRMSFVNAYPIATLRRSKQTIYIVCQ